MVKTVIGSFDRVDDADRAIRALRGAGFLDSDINLVANDVRRGDTAEPTVRNVAGETTSGAATGAVAGGALGGAAGLAASLMGLAIPGIGPILAAGPIVALEVMALSLDLVKVRRKVAEHQPAQTPSNVDRQAGVPTNGTTGAVAMAPLEPIT